MRSTTQAILERAARIYNTNRDASQALGITTRTFTRQCEQLGIEAPGRRKRAQRERARREPE